MISMAIKINLLLPTERQPLWSTNRVMVFIAVLSVAIVGAIISFNIYSIWKLEKKIGITEYQFEMLRPAQDKMVLADSQSHLINTKNNLLTKLTNERRPWAAIIAKLSVITPQQVWLTELAVAEQNCLRVKGNAVTYEDLANFLKQLEQDELLTKPLLVKAERDPVRRLTRFELTVKIKETCP
ncbi:hypothetical protein SRRS_21990 [Sporomusa rhizae]